jgi:hypothetical protein
VVTFKKGDLAPKGEQGVEQRKEKYMLRLLMSDLIFHPLLLAGLATCILMLKRIQNMLARGLHPAAV